MRWHVIMSDKTNIKILKKMKSVNQRNVYEIIFSLVYLS